MEDSFQSIKAAGSYNGERSIVLLVQRQPDANTVQVVDGVRKLLPRFRAQLPESVAINLVNDRSVSIREAIHDVNLTLALTVVLVVLVIFLFLRRLAATFIPAVTMPISLLGALALLYAFGYSLDNVSLLGITLAVGLVVDDAIVVLENIVRHIELGKKPLQAALIGSREMGFTIVSISISLVAVFIPIFFMPGVMGLMFHEFAVVVGLSVLVSAIVSLTLVPMLAARFMPADSHETSGDDSFIGRHFERGFNGVRNFYARTLDLALHHRFIVLGIAFRHLCADGLAVYRDSERLLPGRGPGPDPRQHGSVGRHLHLGHAGAAGESRRRDPGQPEREGCDLLYRWRQYRSHVPGAEAARRAAEDAAGAGQPAQGNQEDRRHPGLPEPGAEPAARWPSFQEPLPVHLAVGQPGCAE